MVSKSNLLTVVALVAWSETDTCTDVRRLSKTGLEKGRSVVSSFEAEVEEGAMDSEGNRPLRDETSGLDCVRQSQYEMAWSDRMGTHHAEESPLGIDSSDSLCTQNVLHGSRRAR